MDLVENGLCIFIPLNVKNFFFSLTETANYTHNSQLRGGPGKMSRNISFFYVILLYFTPFCHNLCYIIKIVVSHEAGSVFLISTCCLWIMDTCLLQHCFEPEQS